MTKNYRLPGKAEGNMEVDKSELCNSTPHTHDIISPVLEIFIVIDVIFLIFCLIGNTIVIWVILKNKILNNPSFMFIISVAAAHLFVGVCVLPMFIVSHFPDDHMSSFVCKFMMYVTKVSTTASSLSLVPMTFDSYNRYSPHTKRRIRFKDAYIQISIVWTTAFLYAIWVPFMHDKVEEIHHTGQTYVKVQMCEVTNEDHKLFKLYILIDFFFMYVVPLVTMIVLNLIISWWIWHHEQKHAEKSAQRMRKMITCSSVILITSFALFGFGNYGMLYRIFWGKGYFPQAFLLRDVFALSSFSLSWINVVLLFGFNPTFREVVFSRQDSQNNSSDIGSNGEKTNKIGCSQDVSDRTPSCIKTDNRHEKIDTVNDTQVTVMEEQSGPVTKNDQSIV